MAAEPYTIGYYDESATPGGTTRYLFDLLTGIDRRLFRPIFLTPFQRPWHHRLSEIDVPVFFSAPPGAQKSQPSAAEDCTSSSLPERSGPPSALSWSLGLAGEIRRAYRLFKSVPIDLLHSNNVGAEAAPVAARLAGVRVVGTLHVDPTYDLFEERGSFRYRALERACLRSLHHAISVSERTKQIWIQRCKLSADFERRRMSVVYNGINAERLKRRRSPEQAKAIFNLPPDSFVIGSLGRLDHAKGYEYLIRALPEFLRQKPNSYVLIGGQGPLKKSLEDLARELQVQDHLILPGFCKDVRDILESADVYIQPSLCEALPYGVIEACCLALPILASEIGGMPEIVRPGDAGCVFPARDAGAITVALLQFANDERLRKEAGERALRTAVQRFSVQRMIDSTANVYLKTIPASQLGFKSLPEGTSLAQ